MASPEAEFHRITSLRFMGRGNTSFGGSHLTVGRSAASRANAASDPSDSEGGESAARHVRRQRQREQCQVPSERPRIWTASSTAV